MSRRLNFYKSRIWNSNSIFCNINISLFHRIPQGIKKIIKRSIRQRGHSLQKRNKYVHTVFEVVKLFSRPFWYCKHLSRKSNFCKKNIEVEIQRKYLWNQVQNITQKYFSAWKNVAKSSAYNYILMQNAWLMHTL